MYLFSYLEWKSYLLNPQIKWLTQYFFLSWQHNAITKFGLW
jgi:hypothetical protein